MSHFIAACLLSHAADWHDHADVRDDLIAGAAAIDRLMTAIRIHRDGRGDRRSVDDLALYRVLDEEPAPSPRG